MTDIHSNDGFCTRSSPATLATVKHGGCVQLANSERERFEACAHAQSYRGGNILTDRDADHPELYADPLAQLAWKIWQAALSAQPSPGGQGDADTVALEIARQFMPIDAAGEWNEGQKRAALQAAIARAINAALAARQPVRIYGCCSQPEGELHTAECPNMRHLAAHQPVGEPVAYKFEDRTADACWTDQYWHKLPPWEHRNPIPLYAAPPAQAVDLTPASIPDTPEVRDILGRPNFWCSPWANVLRMRGDAIPRKAEEEQAAVIRFMLNHYLANGADWAETAGAELDAIRKADSQAAGNG